MLPGIYRVSHGIIHSTCIQGYLKISIQVLGPGDNPKHSPSQTEIDQDGVDIEA